jgi:hypothetical protein
MEKEERLDSILQRLAILTYKAQNHLSNSTITTWHNYVSRDFALLVVLDHIRCQRKSLVRTLTNAHPLQTPPLLILYQQHSSTGNQLYVSSTKAQRGE